MNPGFTTTDHDDRRHRGGAWEVAYADFVTALMALFIVLWLMNSDRKVREAISGYFQNPHGFKGKMSNGQSLMVAKDEISLLKQKLEQAMQQTPGFSKFASNVHVTVTAEGLRVELLENDGGMFFETGSSHPTGYGENIFRMLASEIRNMPHQVAIEGHTDARPFRSGSAGYGNWELSFDRANMARRVMLAHGLRAEQITEIRGFADRRMLVPGSPHDSRNRRVSVVMKHLDN